MFRLGMRSLLNLNGVHPDLVRVVKKAISISEVDFTVIEGKRTLARQRQLLQQKATTTLNSRHIPGKDGYAKAVDIVPYVNGRIRWDWPLFYPLAEAMKMAADIEQVKIVWGGDWKNFKDGPHFELDRTKYP